MDSLVSVAAGLTLRWALGAVFLAAAVAKLRDPSAFARAVEGYGLPEQWRGSVGLVVPIAEAVLGLLWFSTVDPGIVAALTGGALVAFSVAAVAGPSRSGTCGCGGVLLDDQRGWNVAARNGVLLVIATAAIVLGSLGYPHSVSMLLAAAMGALALVWFISALDATLATESSLRRTVAVHV